MHKNLLIILACLTIFISGCQNTSEKTMTPAEEAFLNEDYTTAIALYDKEIKANPNNEKANSMYCGAQSFLYEKDGSVDLNLAMKYCDKALSLNDKNPDTYYFKCRIMAEIKPDDAIKECDKAIEIDPKYGKAYLGKAFLELNNKKDIQNAIKDLKKGIRYKQTLNNPDTVLYAYKYLGDAYLKLHYGEKMQKEYRRIANYEIHRDSSDLYAVKGFAKFRLHDIDGAIADLDKAIMIDDTNYRGYVLLVPVLLFKGEETRALDLINLALTKVKRPERLYFGRALIYDERNKSECIKNKVVNCKLSKEARADIKKAKDIANKYHNKDLLKDIENYENPSLIYRTRGDIKAELSQKKEAVADYLQAIKLAPEDARLYYRVATIMVQLGQFEDALKYCDKYVSLQDTNPHAYFTRGYIKDILGDYKGGIKDYYVALQLDPNMEVARKNLWLDISTLVKIKIKKVFQAKH